MIMIDAAPICATPEAALRAFFDAGEAGDVEAARACTIPDFLLFENGREEGIADMERAIARLRDTGVTIRWTLSDIRQRIEGDLATLIYRNAAVIQTPGEAEPQYRRWLESAVLVRERGWRISFLHSTAVAEA